MPHVDWILNSGSKQVSKGRGLHGGGAKSNKLHQQDFYEGFSLSMKQTSQSDPPKTLGPVKH